MENLQFFLFLFEEYNIKSEDLFVKMKFYNEKQVEEIVQIVMENKHSEEKNDQNKKNLNDINKESSNSNIKSPLSSNEGSSNSANELKAKNIRIKEEKKKLKKGKPKTHSLKLSKLGGDAFEAMISYKIANKFFIEDIETDVSKKEKNFTAKQILPC